ncbi:MAG: protein translocase subunit SecF, partial [Pseudomonadota bacterium]
MRLKLVPENTSIDFFRWVPGAAVFSMVAMVGSIALMFLLGLNFGIDFRGGTTVRTESTQPVDIGLYRDALTPLELGDISITEVFDPTFAADQNVAMIRIQAQE